MHKGPPALRAKRPCRSRSAKRFPTTFRGQQCSWPATRPPASSNTRATRTRSSSKAGRFRCWPGSTTSITGWSRCSTAQRCCRSAARLYSEEGSDKTTGTTRFDRPARRAFYERQSDTNSKIDFPIPAGTQDGLAAFYAIRAHAFKAGERFSIPVADSGSMYTVQVDVAPAGVDQGAGWRVQRLETDRWALPTRRVSRSGRTSPSGFRTTPAAFP